MERKRIFEGPELKKKTEDYHGKCSYAHIGPEYTGKSLTIDLLFSEALKLSLALQSCLLNLNRLDQRNVEGKNMGVSISITTGNKAMKVIEKKIKP